ncbi:Uncharacterized protein TCM_021129 [Theobroma cacao]|uniref:Uncharacterized protein n=1 Tax=Theobroma cacao TaxID=3641 RepID=A0A061EMW6_THECC|nr:Uncharacterized protein TCM_021129 [Theobroma cacao]
MFQLYFIGQFPIRLLNYRREVEQEIYCSFPYGNSSRCYCDSGYEGNAYLLNGCQGEKFCSLCSLQNEAAFVFKFLLEFKQNFVPILSQDMIKDFTLVISFLPMHFVF